MNRVFAKGQKVLFRPDQSIGEFKKGETYTGVITSISDRSVKKDYPIMVEFDNNNILLFTEKGQYHKYDESIVLSVVEKNKHYLESIFKSGDIVVWESGSGDREGKVVSVATGEIKKGLPNSLTYYPVLVKFKDCNRTFTHDGRLVADGVINLRFKAVPQNKTEVKTVLHKPFAVGDKVIRSINVLGDEHTKGVVQEITRCVSDFYIVCVKFEDSKHLYYYSVDGVYCKGQGQTLFHESDFNNLFGNNKVHPMPDFGDALRAHIKESSHIPYFSNNDNDSINKEYITAGLKDFISTRPNTFEISNEEAVTSTEAYKDDSGKLFYEIDFKFITHIAERMASNKVNGKYEPFNWKKPIDEKGIDRILQATFRHMLELMNGNYEDDGRPFGHLEAVASNIMIINHHVRKPQPFDYRKLHKNY